MNITAIAALAQPPATPAGISDERATREAVGREFGRMLFQTMMQGMGGTAQKGHKSNAAGAGMSMELVTGQFAQQLAAQHQQLFAELLFAGNNQGAQR